MKTIPTLTILTLAMSSCIMLEETCYEQDINIPEVTLPDNPNDSTISKSPEKTLEVTLQVDNRNMQLIYCIEKLVFCGYETDQTCPPSYDFNNPSVVFPGDCTAIATTSILQDQHKAIWIPQVNLQQDSRYIAMLCTVHYMTDSGTAVPIWCGDTEKETDWVYVTENSVRIEDELTITINKDCCWIRCENGTYFPLFNEIHFNPSIENWH